MRLLYAHIIFLVCLLSCSCNNKKTSGKTVDYPSLITNDKDIASTFAKGFDADSAFSSLAKQVNFGPRVPNTTAHKLTGEFISSFLKAHGLSVIEQRMDLKTFDGKILKALNIFGQFNPEAENRILLVAHYDCRPWADQDSDPSKHSEPVSGANDGASGVAVLLEIARNLALSDSKTGVDFLFADAEDWGEDSNDDSWAMGTRYFVKNAVKPGYYPSEVIVADMVGGKGAIFPVEYFSQQNSPDLTARIWQSASAMGHSERFPKKIGGAVTDDHIEFIKAGIPAVDIIEYYPGQGFDPDWHTSHDTLDNIDPSTLKAVGETILHYILSSQ